MEESNNTAPALHSSDAEARKEAARLMGAARTPAKIAASRENGKNGGRKPGTPQSAETRAKISEKMKAARARQKAAKAHAEGGEQPGETMPT